MAFAMERVESDRTTISEAVVTAVANAEGVEPEALSPRLYDVVDPDALETLFDRQHHDSVTVSFVYGDWTVHINDGVVTVSGDLEASGVGEESGTPA